MAAKEDPVVELVEEEEEEWPEAGVQNVEEAEQYQDKINNIFNHLSVLIHEDTKTALSQTIQNFKKVVTKQWESMGGRRRGRCPQIHQRPDGIIPKAAFDGRGASRWWTPLKKYHWDSSFSDSYQNGPGGAEETTFIVDIFSHVAQAHKHLSEVCANITALTKITDKSTLMSVINGAVWPLVQLNIPEGFLNPIKDKKALTSKEEKKEKVKKTVLPFPDTTCLKHETRNGLTHILMAAVCLKMSRKYFNEGTAKEACNRFNVRAKQLSRVLTGRKYLGGTQACKRKATDEPPAKRKKSDS